MRDLDVFLQAMELDAIPVVDVDIFLLRDGEILVVVKPSYICIKNIQNQCSRHSKYCQVCAYL